MQQLNQSVEQNNILNEISTNRRAFMFGSLVLLASAAGLKSPIQVNDSEEQDENIYTLEETSALLNIETINGVEYKRYVVTTDTHEWLEKDTLFETREDASAPCNVHIPIGKMINGQQILGAGTNCIGAEWIKNGDFYRSKFEEQYGLSIRSVTDILITDSKITNPTEPGKPQKIAKFEVRITNNISATGEAGYLGNPDICPADNLTVPKTYISLHTSLIKLNAPLNIAEAIGTVYIHEFFHVIQGMGGYFPEESRPDNLTITMPRETMASMYARHWYQRMQDKNDPEGKNLIKILFGRADDANRAILKSIQTKYEYLAAANLWLNEGSGALITDLPNGMSRGYSTIMPLRLNGLTMSEVMQRMNNYCVTNSNQSTFGEMVRAIDPNLPTDYLELAIMGFEEILFDENATQRYLPFTPEFKHYAEAAVNMAVYIDHEAEYQHRGSWLKPNLYMIDPTRINTIEFQNGGDHIIAFPGIGQEAYRVTQSNPYMINPSGVFPDRNGKIRMIIYDRGTSANQSSLKFGWREPVDPQTLTNKAYLPKVEK